MWRSHHLVWLDININKFALKTGLMEMSVQLFWWWTKVLKKKKILFLDKSYYLSKTFLFQVKPPEQHHTCSSKEARRLVAMVFSICYLYSVWVANIIFRAPGFYFGFWWASFNRKMWSLTDKDVAVHFLVTHWGILLCSGHRRIYEKLLVLMLPWGFSFEYVRALTCIFSMSAAAPGELRGQLRLHPYRQQKFI